MRALLGGAPGEADPGGRGSEEGRRKDPPPKLLSIPAAASRALTPALNGSASGPV
jgi:hypothetical protein